jgi:hypothetical protein
VYLLIDHANPWSVFIYGSFVGHCYIHRYIQSLPVALFDIQNSNQHYPGCPQALYQQT